MNRVLRKNKVSDFLHKSIRVKVGFELVLS